MLHVTDAKFTLYAYTITWPNGVDFAPEFIKGLKTI